jgi:hypothetical protein
VSGTFTIEAQDDHEYVVTLQADAEIVESWFRVTPELLEGLGAGPDDEERVVRQTIEFLGRHQDAADFPRIVELEDVMATYEGYVAAMQAGAPTG